MIYFVQESMSTRENVSTHEQRIVHGMACLPGSTQVGATVDLIVLTRYMQDGLIFHKRECECSFAVQRRIERRSVALYAVRLRQ